VPSTNKIITRFKRTILSIFIRRSRERVSVVLNPNFALCFLLLLCFAAIPSFFDAFQPGLCAFGAGRAFFWTAFAWASCFSSSSAVFRYY
jgi:hypothetical protein